MEEDFRGGIQPSDIKPGLNTPLIFISKPITSYTEDYSKCSGGNQIVSSEQQI